MKILTRSLIFLLFIISLNITIIYGATIENENGEVLTIVERSADEPTFDNYKEVLIDENYTTTTSGNIWADKSVIANKTGKTDSFTLDNQSIYYNTDFAEVFSLLGSIHSTKGLGSNPIDLVFVIDLSTTMGEATELDYDTSIGRNPKRIDETAKALDEIFEFLYNQNPENRIGLVGFATESVEILPLGRYERVDDQPIFSVTDLTAGDNPYFSFNVKCLGESKETINKSVINQRAPRIPAENTFYVETETNIQSGINTGANEFLKNAKTTNIPKLIIISDGAPNSFDYGGWLNPSGSIYTNSKSGEDFSAILLTTLLTASYDKSAIENLYKQPLEIITLGVDLDPSESSLINGSLKPHLYFNSEGVKGNTALEEAYDYFKKWIQNETVTFNLGPLHDLDYTLEKFNTNNNFGVSLEDLTKNIPYVDYYQDISSNELSEIFDDIVTGFDETMFSFLNDTEKNSEGDVGVVTYIDPIGQYLELKEIKCISLFGKNYQIIKEKENYNPLEDTRTTTYKIYTPGEKVLSNALYLDPQTFSLDDFVINYIEKNKEAYLKITIPEAAIPFIKTSITFDTQTDSDGNRYIKEYSVTEDSEYSKPLRVIYTVGLNSNLFNKEGNLTTENVNSQYLQNHQENNLIYFYSNLFSGKDLGIGTCGDAYISFIPSSDNPYFFNQEDLIVYKNTSKNENNISETSLVPVTSGENLEDNKTYYVKNNYYKALKPTDKLFSIYKGTSFVSYTPVKGSSIKRNVIRVQNNLALKSGTHNKEDLSNMSRNKTHNITQTANLLYSPYIHLMDNKAVTYLGNNGKIAVTGASPKIILEKYQAIGSEALTQDPLNVTAGAIITYELKLINTSSFNCKKIVVTDDVPENLILDKSSISNNGIYSNGTITWTIENLSGGSEIYLEFKVSIPNIEKNTWANTGYFSYSDGEDSNPQSSNTVYLYKSNPFVEIEKLQSVNDSNLTKELTNVREGDIVTYYLNVRNTSEDSATDVEIVDALPSDLEIIPDSLNPEGLIEDHTISWYFSSLDPGEEKQLCFSVQIPRNSLETNWKNIASVKHSQVDMPIISNEVAINKQTPNITIDKTQSTSKVLPTTSNLEVIGGERVTYYISVNNLDDVSYENVSVTDQIPQFLITDPDSISHDGIIINNIVTWLLPELSANSSIVLSFDVIVPEQSSVDYWSNTASLQVDNSNNIINSNTVTIIKENRQTVENPPDPTDSNHTNNNVNNTTNNKTNTTTTSDTVTTTTSNSTNSATKVQSNNPKTGINLQSSLWIVLILTSTFVLVIIYFKKILKI